VMRSGSDIVMSPMSSEAHEICISWGLMYFQFSGTHKTYLP